MIPVLQQSVSSPLWLLALLVLPLLAIVLIALRPQAAKMIASVATGLNFLLSLLLLAGFDPSKALNWEFKALAGQLPGLPEITFHIGVDGINLALILLTTIVSLAAVWATPSTVKRPAEFFAYVLLMSVGGLGAFVSFDLFFFFIFHEVALIPTFLLIGIWGSQNRQYAGMQLTLYLTLGSLILLAGLLALVYSEPINGATFNLPEIQKLIAASPISGSSQAAIYPLMLAGFGILISLFPLHTWAAPGYAAAPSAAAMLHAGVLKKFGLYGLLRIALPLLHEGHDVWQELLLILLLGNVVIIGFVTIAQKELPLMLGYSSVMHMGYLFLGLTAYNVTGWSGVVLLMVAHGLSTAMLFGLANEIRERTGETRFAELGGLATKMPFLAVCFIIASMASVGLPGLANFAGEIMIFFGAWEAGWSGSTPILGAWFWVVPVCVLGIIISAIYQLRAVRKVLFGDCPERFAKVTDLTTFTDRAPYILLAVALFLLGLMPSILLQFAQPAVAALLTGTNG